jgi:hypothetical protein
MCVCVYLLTYVDVKDRTAPLFSLPLSHLSSVSMFLSRKKKAGEKALSLLEKIIHSYSHPISIFVINFRAPAAAKKAI